MKAAEEPFKAPAGEFPTATPEQRQHALNILEKECRAFMAIPAGNGLRNDALNKTCHTIGGLIASGCLDEQIAEDRLFAATAEYAKTEGREGVVKTMYSGLQTGFSKPWFPALGAAAELPTALNGSFEEVMRRQQQKRENQDIGEGSEEYPASKVLTVEEMLVRYVHIIEGKRVADLEHPRRIFALDEWKSAYRSSQTLVEEKKDDGSVKVKKRETTSLWEITPARKQVDTVTFRPGAPRMTFDPDGKRAANTWRPIDRTGPAGDPTLFVNHVYYLFGADAGRFADWLAHIEQKPGELPHTGWVHISPSQGTGRNWLASVLCRLWKGYVAASFDLSGTLTSGFNGSLSQKLLAVVDEINEGASDRRWESAEKLKSLVTEEHRRINPKYGHQRLEYNACRWLIFSNHTSALPLTERDRRFNIVRNDLPPMPAGYYGRLYAALKDPEFIAGVAMFLRKRDISAFNPGAHALLNEVKREMVSASRSDADDIIEFLKENHPADIISNPKLGGYLNEQPIGKIQPHHKHALGRAGVQPYGKSIKLAGRPIKVSILRNAEFWKSMPPEQIRNELAKAEG